MFEFLAFVNRGRIEPHWYICITQPNSRKPKVQYSAATFLSHNINDNYNFKGYFRNSNSLYIFWRLKGKLTNFLLNLQKTRRGFKFQTSSNKMKTHLYKTVQIRNPPRQTVLALAD
jgi:hypothetical protein